MAAALATSLLVPGSRLAIIRHGEAVSNVENTLEGHDTCRGLTPHGHEQVAALCRRLRSSGELAGAAALYTSLLRRAVETAEPLCQVLGLESFARSCSLCERHVGEADGLSWPEFEKRYGREQIGVDDERVPVPGGESWSSFLDRAAAALIEVMALHPGRLVVVAGHGGLIGASVIRFLGLPENGAGTRRYADNTSITEWVWTGDSFWFVRYNDAAHLDGTEWGTRRGLRTLTPDWVTEPVLAGEGGEA